MGVPNCKCKESFSEINQVNIDDVIPNIAYEDIEFEESNLSLKQGQSQRTPKLNEEQTNENKENNKKDEKENIGNTNINLNDISDEVKGENKEQTEGKEEKEKNNEIESINNFKIVKIENDVHSPQEKISNENNYKEHSNNNNNIKDNRKLNKKQKENTNINKNINKNYLFNEVTQITEGKKISQLKDNDIIFASELQKMINNKEKKSITYTNRFCTLTKQSFAYYTSKANFMSLKKPLCKINLNYITSIEQATLEDNAEYFCIVFQINEETAQLMKQINSFSVINEEDNNNQEEGILGFKSENNDTIYKWVIMLNYFVHKN